MLPIERLQKSNTIENLWIYVLSLLKKASKEHPIYAWEIPKLVEKEFGFKPGKITPYRVLYRLEKTGFVKSQMEERKRVYKITEKGVKEFEKAKEFYQKIFNKLK
ncbi:MAG: helix-turn-helix transcriptional regulator [Patescibacteria group bacterium]|nr:helix-turn-helix transcriptional regulator [Patescibacteria group bacterium]